MSTQTVTLNIEAQDNATGTLQRIGSSTRDLITGFSGVATSAFNLYNAYDRVADMSVSVDRANLNVKTTLNSVEDARRRLNAELSKEEINEEKVKAATDDLRLAEERHQVAVERAEMIQGNLNETMVQSAIMVIPTTITMVYSLGRIYKNLPDISGSLGKISSTIGTTGTTAATAALGVAAFMGGFLIADTLFKSVPENLRRGHFKGIDHEWAEVNNGTDWLILDPWYIGNLVDIRTLKSANPAFQGASGVEVQYYNGTIIDASTEHGY